MKKSAQYVHTWKYLFSHVAKVDLLCPTQKVKFWWFLVPLQCLFRLRQQWYCICTVCKTKLLSFLKREKKVKLLANSSSSTAKWVVIIIKFLIIYYFVYLCGLCGVWNIKVGNFLAYCNNRRGFLTAKSQVLLSLVEYYKHILMIMILKYSLLDNVPKGALSKRE